MVPGKLARTDRGVAGPGLGQGMLMNGARKDDTVVDQPPVTIGEEGLDSLERVTAELIDDDQQNQSRCSRRRCSRRLGHRFPGAACSLVSRRGLTRESHQTARRAAMVACS